MVDSANLQGADAEVLAAARTWLANGQRVALVTVLHTWGSSPRPPGSLAAIGSDDGLAGSVSGGCVEEALIDRYRGDRLARPFPTRVDFGVDREEAARLGLPCGGRMELLVEELDAPQPLDVLLDEMAAGRLVARRVCLRTGEVSLHPSRDEPELAIRADSVTKVLGPAWHLLLIGDGQLARYVAQLGRMLGYRVSICDPRALFADPHPLDDVRYTSMMPDEAVRDLADHPRSAVVTLAHDPKQDDMALIEALASHAFYVGALGSMRTSRARRDRLARIGLTSAQIDRLDAPAGLPIGSKRPAEIALSIVAGITAARNRIGEAGR
ncbi:MAG: XdhC family protein [Thiohalocapsa sp.]|nr:XdhC family protein [Thiohalocapsa sp.]